MNPQATNHPISWFRKFYSDGLLDLTPKFQRKPVWSDAQASYLVDSVLNDLPIPEVFVRTATTEAGEQSLQVVDGQQRLRSIIRFFSDELVLEGDNVADSLKGCSWKRLDGPTREKFWSFKLVVRELEGASDQEVRDIFRRLNANQESLNDQELRHSQYQGQFIVSVEALADDPWWIENRIVTPSQVRRMLDVEFVSELLVGLMAGPLDKKKGIDDFFVDYDDEFPDRSHWESVFLRTRELCSALTRDDYRGWRSKTEFYSLFLGCGRLVIDQKAPKGKDLPKAISRLRKFRGRVDRAKRKDTREDFPNYVADYAEAATRASTDLGRRLYRIGVIESLVTGETPKRAS